MSGAGAAATTPTHGPSPRIELLSAQSRRSSVDLSKQKTLNGRSNRGLPVVSGAGYISPGPNDSAAARGKRVKSPSYSQGGSSDVTQDGPDHRDHKDPSDASAATLHVPPRLERKHSMHISNMPSALSAKTKKPRQGGPDTIGSTFNMAVAATPQGAPGKLQASSTLPHPHPSNASNVAPGGATPQSGGASGGDAVPAAMVPGLRARGGGANDEELQKECETLRQRIRIIEEERDDLIQRLQHEDLRHEERVNKLVQEKEEITRVLEAQKERSLKEQDVDNAVIALYMEFKDRSFEPEEGADDREEKRRLQHDGPIAVLEKLRGNLLSLKSFKEDFENELRSNQQRRNDENLAKIETLKREIHESRNNEQRARDDKRKLKLARQKEELIGNKRLEHAESEYNKLIIENQKLLEQMEQHDQKILELQQRIRQHEETIDVQRDQLIRSKALENRLNTLKKQHLHELARIEKNSQTTMKKLEKEATAMSFTEHEHKRLLDELKRAKQEIQAYKNDVRQQSVSAAGKRTDHLAGIIESQTKHIRRLTEELRQANFISEEMIKENIMLKHALEREKAKKKELSSTSTSKLSGTGKSKIENEALGADSTNPEHSRFYVEYYKAKLGNKEEEVDALNKRLKKLRGEYFRQQLEKGGTPQPAPFMAISSYSSFDAADLQQQLGGADGRRSAAGGPGPATPLQDRSGPDPRALPNSSPALAAVH